MAHPIESQGTYAGPLFSLTKIMGGLCTAPKFTASCQKAKTSSAFAGEGYNNVWLSCIL